MHLDYRTFHGEHCETTATGNLLYHQEVFLSEPMMFGLGEGLGFIFLNLSSLNTPFIGGRSKPFELTKALCRNLNLELSAQETRSKNRALANLTTPLNEGYPVGLQLDSYHLPYFSAKIHFAGHAVACCGIEGDEALLLDTEQQGGLHKVRLSQLEQARFEKGPMAAKARSWTIKGNAQDIKLDGAIKTAISNNAKQYMSPAFKGMSYLGIEKLAKSLPKWSEIAADPREDLVLAAKLMEKAGTGGAIFRNFYARFLTESFERLGLKLLGTSAKAFTGIAKDWSYVAELIDKAGKEGRSPALTEASEVCRSLAIREKEAMSNLATLSQ